MERFSGEVVAHDDDDERSYFIQPHSKYVRAVVRKISSFARNVSDGPDGDEVAAGRRSLVRAQVSTSEAGTNDPSHCAITNRPTVGTLVDFTFHETDLLSAVSVRSLRGASKGQREDVRPPVPSPQLAVRTTSAMAEVQCPVCLEIMVQPSTISCGHSACLLCMTQSLRYRGTCSQCRSPHTEPLSINIALRDAIVRLFPEERRLSEPAETLLPSEEEQAESLREAVHACSELWLLNMFLCGYDPNSRLAETGNNALAHAVRNGNEEMVKILLEHGADVDLQDADGDTALMNAAYFRRPRTAEFLLERGADPTLLAESGYTAADYARRPGYNDAPPIEDLVRTIESAEAAWTAARATEPADDEETAPPRSAARMAVGNEAPLDGGPRWMRVAVAAPMARAGASLGSVPVGRLRDGDRVLVTASAVRGEVRMLRYSDGPGACPEGWLPEYLPSSDSRVLVEIEPSNSPGDDGSENGQE